MPTTRKKVIKTVYKDEDDSEPENADFSDSGSEAVISQQSSSEDDNEDVPEGLIYSEDKKKKKKVQKVKLVRSITFQKSIINKANEQRRLHLKNDEYDSDHKDEPKINIKDLTDADKLLPSILNLSESDSSDDETPKPTRSPTHTVTKPEDIETEIETEYKDVWSNNLQQSEEIAQKAFLELEKHKTKLEETKQSIEQYTLRNENSRESDVKDLLALGEELPSVSQIKVKKRGNVKARNDSDSDIEDWEEVAEGKTLPQQGLQLVVDFPDAIHRKKKKLDVEMMMKRKINRVKKEYQVYMHKVHVLCWLGHGNFVSQVLNDQEVMSAALSLIPSKECYPGERVDIKYVEQITTWFKDKLKVTYDKHEGKYRPKAPPLKSILIEQIKSRIVTSKKYVVYIFVSMLRAVGLQCRVMLNFTTLPIKPPATELCSLSTKANVNENSKEKKDVKNKECKKKINKNTTKIPQLDGNYDSFSDSDFDNIMQLDGNDDAATSKGVKSPAKGKTKIENKVVEDVSPPKRPRRNLSIKKVNSELNKSNDIKSNENNETQSNKLIKKEDVKDTKGGKEVIGKVTRKSLSLRRNKPDIENEDNSSLSNVKDTKGGKEVIGKVTRKSLSLRRNKPDIENEDNSSLSNVKDTKLGKEVIGKVTSKSLSLRRNKPDIENEHNSSTSIEVKIESAAAKKLSLRKTKNTRNNDKPDPNPNDLNSEAKHVNIPKIVVTENQGDIASEYFNNSSVGKPETERGTRARKRSHTSNLNEKQNNTTQNDSKKPRAKSVPGKSSNKSKYFDNTTDKNDKSEAIDDEDSLRVNHKDLVKSKSKPKNDVTNDLVKIIKKRVKEAKLDTKKGKTNKSSDEDSDYLPEVSESENPTATKKTKGKGSSRKIDRRVLSTDDEAPSHKIDVWCEIYVEELEQWIAVDVIKGRVHCVNEIYRGATHPMNYVVGWDNNNYLKDLTRRYVPHWNTVTRKQRVDPAWWDTAVQPWLGPKTPRDREEDESLDRMQLDAPLPKSIAEYKNHPLYALKRHLLKFEAIYPPDAATLGFVRGEAVYARDCVYVCRSRDTWLKEAKVVRLGEKPYKVVKARPKWDKLSNKLITDKPLEVFGPWQVQDYEPPVAENGIVPRNAYGNVELFKDCMLPKGTVHIKLPGLNRVARKLNIDCAPAMTGFDFNGGWSHPVYDGFVVCEEFEEIITNAWHEDQLEQERKEIEKLEARVYGNWKRLIKGLLIRERLKLKYGFSEPTTSQETKKKSIGPRLAVNKKCLKK